MIDKKFRHGDLVVTTSGRDAKFNGISTDLKNACIYDRDVTKEEASALYYMQLRRLFPTVDFTYDDIEYVINKHDRLFMNTAGEILSYNNHEKGDIFDRMYAEYGNDIDQLAVMKNRYISEHGIVADSDGHYRCHSVTKRRKQ